MTAAIPLAGRPAAPHHAPFAEEICRQARQRRTSFHMPGHKQAAIDGSALAELWGEAVFLSDLSEVGGLDYLHSPKGALRQAQDLAAQAAGADTTFFLVNGSTGGNHAALLGSIRAGQKVLLPRASHRSVFAALLLSDAVPVYIPPLYHPEAGIPLAVDVEAMASLLRSDPDIAAIQITSPSYYGFTSDVAACAHLAHRHGVPLLVDEAHGAHFAFHPDLPTPALKAGADLVVQSTHKTLGALTQASMLHLRRGYVEEWRVQQALAMLQSSSPSALLTASLDMARAMMASEGEARLARTIELAEQARCGIRALPGLWCWGEDLIGKGGVYDYDPTKLLICVRELGLTGFEVADWLQQHCNIEVEFGDREHILCAFTFNDGTEEAAVLLRAMQDLACRRSHVLPDVFENGSEKRDALRKTRQQPAMPIAGMSLREATFAPATACPLRLAIGRICAESVIPYPPGVPALLPGEIITAEMVEYLAELVADGSKIVGPLDKSLQALRVVA